MAVSATDKNKLSSEQQAAVQSYTDQYYAAKAKGDTEAMNAAHAAAESVRNQAGYSGGSNGSGNTSVSSAQTAQQVQNYLNQYRADNAANTYESGGKQYWNNNYSAQDNLRSQANAIRQQMLQNSQNWHNATTQEEKDYLHEQNVALNNLLNQYAGGVESRYDGSSGKWYTENADLGYGDIENYDRKNAKNIYGVTDADLDRYVTNTDRYYTLQQQNPANGAANTANGGIIQGNAYASGATPGTDIGNGNVGGGGTTGSGVLSNAGAAGNGSGVVSGGSGSAGSSGSYTTGTGGTTGSGSTYGRNTDLSGYLDQWQQAAANQAQNQIDYAVNQGVNELQRAEEDAQAQFQTQRNQIAADEAQGLDNSALYAELRGDRGGIGNAQYNSIQNTAATNRQTVNSEQVKLATDTQRQIADLRAQGEFEKADKLLEISQSYLSQLIGLEQWAAEYDLSAAQFQESIRQWEKEYELSVANLMGTYNGQPTLSAKNAQATDLATAGEALLSAGILPSEEQAEAMGYTMAQLQLILAQQEAAREAANAATSGYSGGSGTAGTSETGGSDSGTTGSSGTANRTTGSTTPFEDGVSALVFKDIRQQVTKALANGDVDSAFDAVQNDGAAMNAKQYNEIVKIFHKNGLNSISFIQEG